jgi:Asp-tRNA(Asn)/Glu-tRNA(Gln) amidotransferase A subunit family amidase
MKQARLLYASVIDLADAIRARQISSVGVVTAFLERSEALNPILNTVIRIAPESALEQARAADEALARGQNHGPLHGIPFTVKDVYQNPYSLAHTVSGSSGERRRTSQPAARHWEWAAIRAAACAYRHISAE